jgi:hypothetical protein
MVVEDILPAHTIDCYIDNMFDRFLIAGESDDGQQ